MKFLKIMAVIMAVCLLGCAFVACDGNGEGDATEAGTTVSISVTLVVKNAEEEEVGRMAVPYSGSNPTVGAIIELYNAAMIESDNEEDYDPYDDKGTIVKIGEETVSAGQYWAGYFEDQGKNNEFSSLKDQAVTDGQTVVVYINTP